jgi:hypothetical protein
VTRFEGGCDCGDVKFVCEGEPLFTQYCHCNKCREIAALSTRDADKSGYTHTAAYLTLSFIVTSGRDKFDTVIRNEAALFSCKSCHSPIFGISLDESKQAGIGINVNNFYFSDGIPEAFKSVRHTWYSNRIVELFENDGLPKYKNTPQEQFGSGELYSELEESIRGAGPKI